MLSRIEQSFEQLQRFTADASHELRTPLAAIRSIGEVRLQEDAKPEEYRDTIGSMLEEVNRLTAIVESLLTLSRADAGQIRLQVSVFPMMALVREAAALLGGSHRRQAPYVHSCGRRKPGRGGRPTLRAAGSGQHSAQCRQVYPQRRNDFRARSNARGYSQVELSRSRDSGPGIPAEQSAKIFDRFYRVDEARAGEDKGAGLGLSIAKWAVQANDGEIGVSKCFGDRRNVLDLFTGRGMRLSQHETVRLRSVRIGFLAPACM